MREDDFKKKLNPTQFRLMRTGGGMEEPYLGKYWDVDEHGIYFCAACDAPLFTSLAKFDAETGWPSFRKPATNKAIIVRTDKVLTCGGCRSTLGTFIDGRDPHYRLNSSALDFVPMPEIEIPEDGGDTRAITKEDLKKSAKADAPAAGDIGRAGNTFATYAAYAGVAGAGTLIGVLGGVSYATLSCRPEIAVTPVTVSAPPQQSIGAPTTNTVPPERPRAVSTPGVVNTIPPKDPAVATTATGSSASLWAEAAYPTTTEPSSGTPTTETGEISGTLPVAADAAPPESAR